MHVVASDEYLDCEDLIPARCESINVDVSVEEILAAGGYGYVAFVAYDVDGLTGAEFAVSDWPTGRGAPPLMGPYWCPEGTLTLGNPLDGGGIITFPCAEAENGIVLLGYLSFGPADEEDFPIDLEYEASAFSYPNDAHNYVLDCTIEYREDPVVATSGCRIGGTYSDSLPDCPGGEEGGEGGEGSEDEGYLSAEPRRLYVDLAAGDSALVSFELRNSRDGPVSYRISSSVDWIAVESDSGVVEAQGATEVALTLRAPVFPSGRYEGEITIEEQAETPRDLVVRVLMSTYRRAVKGHCGSVENEYVEGQILFKVRPGVGEDTIAELLSDIDAVMIRDVNDLRWGAAEVPPSVDQDAAMDALGSSYAIESAEKNWVVYLRWDATPNDTLYDRQWSLNHTESNSPEGCTPDSDIDMPEAWEITDGSPNVLLAIVDTGIAMEEGELCHPDLDDPDRFLLGLNTTSSGDSTDVSDAGGHGTAVIGIAAAETDNTAGIAGVCPKCKVMVFKGLADTCPSPECSLEALAALEAAVDNGAHVVNLSWGMYCDSIPQVWEDVIAKADSHDCLIVSAMDNLHSWYSDGIPEILAIAGEEEGHECGYRNVIPVAASNCKDSLAQFSCWGPMVGIAAPGGTGWGLHPRDEDILSTTSGIPARPCSVAYKPFWGCSFAPPHVTGLAGLIRSLGAFPDSLVSKIIFCTADQIDSETHPYDEGIVCWDLEGDSTIAIGTLDCFGTPRYRNERYGYGRINAQRAVALADSLAATGVLDDSWLGSAGTGQRESLNLWQNHPNPCNPTTEIRFYVPSDGIVRLSVYDVQGRRVCSLEDGQMHRGHHSVVWDGTQDSGLKVSSGVYFLHLRAGGEHRTVKLVVLE